MSEVSALRLFRPFVCSVRSVQLLSASPPVHPPVPASVPFVRPSVHPPITPPRRRGGQRSARTHGERRREGQRTPGTVGRAADGEEGSAAHREEGGAGRDLGVSPAGVLARSLCPAVGREVQGARGGVRWDGARRDGGGQRAKNFCCLVLRSLLRWWAREVRGCGGGGRGELREGRKLHRRVLTRSLWCGWWVGARRRGRCAVQIDDSI